MGDVPVTVLLATGLAAGPAHAESDQVPGEIALLIVSAAVLVAVTALVIRSARARGWRPGRLRTVLVDRKAGAEPADPDAVVASQDLASSKKGADGPDGAGSRGWRPRAAALVSVAVVVGLAGLLSTAVYVLGNGDSTTSRPGIAAGSASPVPGQPASATPDGGSKAPGKHPAKAANAGSKPNGKQPAKAAGPGGSAVPGQSPGSGGSGGSSGSPTSPPPAAPPPTSAPPPAPAAIVLPSQPVVLDQINSANPPTFSGYFTLSAVNGSVGYSVTYSPADEITFIDNTSGTVSPGQTVYISIEVTQLDPGSVPFLSVDPGGAVQLELVGCGSEGVSC